MSPWRDAMLHATCPPPGKEVLLAKWGDYMSPEGHPPAGKCMCRLIPATMSPARRCPVTRGSANHYGPACPPIFPLVICCPPTPRQSASWRAYSRGSSFLVAQRCCPTQPTIAHAMLMPPRMRAGRRSPRVGRGGAVLGGGAMREVGSGAGSGVARSLSREVSVGGP